MSSKALNRIWTAMFFAAWANFAAFCYVGMRIGGEAIHGKIEDGHYYLATGYVTRGVPNVETPHRYIEVSANVFQYSRIHGYSVLVTFPLGLIAAFLGFLNQKKRKHELQNVA